MDVTRHLLALAVALTSLAAAAPAHAIVGGKAAPPGKYPFFAVLEVDDRFSCGASLVAPDTVLTAAHCVTEGDDSVTKASRLSFVIGRDRLSDTGKGEDIPAAEVIRHEEFDSSTFVNDVALVRLSRPSAAPTIRLADPATERDRWAPRKPATVIGHGGTFFPGIGGVNTTNDLHEVQVPIVDDRQCDTTVGIDETSMVCAGNDLGGADSCNGDSGGPLMVTDAAGAFIQVGTVSFGTGCGFPTQYGVYGRVGDAKLHDWVTARIAVPAATGSGTSAPAPGGAARPAPTSSAPSRPAEPAPGPAPHSSGPGAAPGGRARVGVLSVRRSGRRVVVRLRSTGPVKGLRATLVLVRGDRRVVLGRRSLARINGRRTVVFRLKRAPGKGRLRVETRTAAAG